MYESERLFLCESKGSKHVIYGVSKPFYSSCTLSFSTPTLWKVYLMQDQCLQKLDAGLKMFHWLLTRRHFWPDISSEIQRGIVGMKSQCYQRVFVTKLTTQSKRKITSMYLNHLFVGLHVSGMSFDSLCR